jgi:hypothetical protein
MGNTLAIGGVFTEFRVGVNLIEVSRQAGKSNDITLRNRSTGGNDFLADFKLLKIQSRDP